MNSKQDTQQAKYRYSDYLLDNVRIEWIIHSNIKQLRILRRPYTKLDISMMNRCTNKQHTSLNKDISEPLTLEVNRYEIVLGKLDIWTIRSFCVFK